MVVSGRKVPYRSCVNARRAHKLGTGCNLSTSVIEHMRGNHRGRWRGNPHGIGAAGPRRPECRRFRAHARSPDDRSERRRAATFPRRARCGRCWPTSRFLRMRSGAAVSATCCGMSRMIHGANSVGASASSGPFSMSQVGPGSRRPVTRSHSISMTVSWMPLISLRPPNAASRRSIWSNCGPLPTVRRRLS